MESETFEAASITAVKVCSEIFPPGPEAVHKNVQKGEQHVQRSSPSPAAAPNPHEHAHFTLNHINMGSANRMNGEGGALNYFKFEREVTAVCPKRSRQ